MSSRVRTPTVYVGEKLAMIRRRAASPFGQAVQRMVGTVWPGVPWEAFLGFTALSMAPGDPAGITEDTGALDRNTGRPMNRFHEIGPFQTEAGPSQGYPGGALEAPAPGDADNSWKRLHNDATVRQLLGGRDATMVPGAWRTAPDDQAAVGLVSLKRHSAGTNRMLDARIRPADPASLWNVAVAFTGFSAGDSAAAATINRYADSLARVPEAQRWGAFLEEVARDVARSTTGTRARPWTIAGHRNPAYDALRTEQKLAVGRALAEGGPRAAWFAVALADRAAMERALVIGATPTMTADGRAAPVPTPLPNEGEGSDRDAIEVTSSGGWKMAAGFAAVTLALVGAAALAGRRAARRNPGEGVVLRTMLGAGVGAAVGLGAATLVEKAGGPSGKLYRGGVTFVGTLAGAALGAGGGMGGLARHHAALGVVAGTAVGAGAGAVAARHDAVGAAAFGAMLGGVVGAAGGAAALPVGASRMNQSGPRSNPLPVPRGHVVASYPAPPVWGTDWLTGKSGWMDRVHRVTRITIGGKPRWYVEENLSQNSPGYVTSHKTRASALAQFEAAKARDKEPSRPRNNPTGPYRTFGACVGATKRGRPWVREPRAYCGAIERAGQRMRGNPASPVAGSVAVKLYLTPAEVRALGLRLPAAAR